jgi:hypothetical protein
VKGLKIALRVLAWVVATPLVAFYTIMGTLILHYSNLPWAWARTSMAVAFAAGVIAAFVLLRPRWKALLAWAGAFGLVLLWFLLIPASNDRNWQPDVARTPSIDVNGDILIVHDVRDFRYRSESDYDARWETRTYDLSKLRTLDLYVSYWGSPAIAHTMLSFGFEGGEHLAVSMEARKQVRQTYSPVGSFFKQFGLITILGDERDLIALRTNFRHEDTYLFPTDAEPPAVRALLLDIIDRANSLARQPEFYRTIRDNCTTSLVHQIDRVTHRPVPFSFKLICNGYIPEMLYERGQLPHDAPIDVVKQRYAISAVARAGPVDEMFSQRIRAHLGAPIVTRKS